MKPSDKQIAANRQNSQKSTGPTSEEGKAIASKNSLKHGLLAKEVVITDGDGAESQEEFDDLLASLTCQYNPQSTIEAMLVEKVAVAHWRLRRAQRYEVGLIRKNLDNTTQEYYEKQDWGSSKRNRTDAQIDADIAEAQERLAEWQDDKAKFLKLQKAGKDLSATYHDYDANWESICEDAYELSVGISGDQPAEIHQSFNNAGFSDQQIWDLLLKDCDVTVTYYENKIGQLEKEKEANAMALQVKKKLNSIPDPANINQLLKYEGTLEKQFYKALNQLERLQRMRAGDAVPPPVNLDVNLDTDSST